MGLWIEQRFCAGRFHATRWRQNPFEDRYGEWPPSPWRLLRALAARWFQYARETGDNNEGKRRRLLAALASSTPQYHLPEFAWPGPPIKQYQPVEIGWSDPAKKAAGVRESSTTLVADSYWCLPPEHPVIWAWPELDLPADDRQLLEELVWRILYFGRAESRCQLRILRSAPPNLTVNCRLQANDPGGGVPVLVTEPGAALDEDALLSPTDGPLLGEAATPPGTTWYYAVLPARGTERPPIIPRKIEPSPLVQFVVGGRILPVLKEWVRLTERVRRAALSSFCRASHDDTPAAWLERLALFTGKNRDGVALTGHAHPYFTLWPDENGLPTRLIVWRQSRPFEELEIESLWSAARWQFGWGVEGWSVRLIPLPAQTPPPPAFGLGRESRTWESVTPFVPPAQRFRLRKNGKARDGETPARVLGKLLAAAGMPDPVIEFADRGAPAWVNLHQTRERRIHVERTRTPFVRPGYYFRVTFPDPVPGPIAVGDSCHFGLGLFRAVE